MTLSENLLDRTLRTWLANMMTKGRKMDSISLDPSPKGTIRESEQVTIRSGARRAWRSTRILTEILRWSVKWRHYPVDLPPPRQVLAIPPRNNSPNCRPSVPSFHSRPDVVPGKVVNGRGLRRCHLAKSESGLYSSRRYEIIAVLSERMGAE